MIARTTEGYAIMDNSEFTDFEENGNFKILFEIKDNKHPYLSPEGYISALKKEVFKLDLGISDVFVAGLIILEAGILEKCYDIYINK